MRTISVTSGKGGVGKTAVSINLAIALAQRGWRAGIIDCDFGLANVALNLGLKPQNTLQHVLDGRPIHDAFTEGPSGLRVLAGSRGAHSLVDLEYGELEDMSVGFEQLYGQFDFMILDNGAGISPGVLSVSAAADETLLVFTPDPSSMMDAYASAKLLFQLKPKARVSCVVNQVRHEREARGLFEELRTIAANFLSEKMTYVGCVRRDEAMVRATRDRRPVTVGQPKSPAARDFSELAARYSGLSAEPPSSGGFIHRLLGERSLRTSGPVRFDPPR